jgi:hypothetical protein
MAKIVIEVPDEWLEKPLSREMSYCVVAWVAFQALKPFWRLSTDAKGFLIRAISRILYSCSFGDKSKGISSGLTSNLNPLPKTMTSDHFIPPESAGTFAMDNQEKYLDNFDTFFNLYTASKYTHKVEKTVNTLLSKVKKLIPKIYSYRDLGVYEKETKDKKLKFDENNGVKLFCEHTKKEVSNLIAPLVKVADGFLTDWCKWENKWIIDADESEFGMPEQKNIDEAEEINLQRRKSLRPITTLKEFYEED